MMRLDTVIRNGEVALSTGVERIDIGIRDGAIAALAQPGELSGAATIEAGGKLVLPGAIDMHVHFRDPGFTEKEDFRHGTTAAACGGVTTICDMPNTHPPVTTPERFAAKLDHVSKSAFVDFGLWAGGVQTEHFRALDALGAVGLKIYMNRAVRASDPYAGELSMPDDATFMATLRAAAEMNWTVCVHVANSPLDEAERERLIAAGRLGAADVCRSYRTPESVEALSRVALFARVAGARLHIAHISLNSIDALDALIDARRKGGHITAEVAPPVLEFAELDRLGPKGVPFAHSADELQRYWDALASGVIDAVATDHAPHTIADKNKGRDNAWMAPPGYPGVETSFPILIDAALNGRFGFDTLTQISSGKPARILGLRHKGAIAPGRDADIVIVDPHEEWVVDQAKLHSKAGWSPFHGRRLRGRIKMTLLRGDVIAENGNLVASTPRGRLVHSCRNRDGAEGRTALGRSAGAATGERIRPLVTGAKAGVQH